MDDTGSAETIRRPYHSIQPSGSGVRIFVCATTYRMSSRPTKLNQLSAIRPTGGAGWFGDTPHGRGRSFTPNAASISSCGMYWPTEIFISEEAVVLDPSNDSMSGGAM